MTEQGSGGISGGRQALRRRLADGTHGRCSYCGCELSGRWHIDHVYPKHRGGGDEESNLAPACARCNRWKATYTVEEFRQEIAAQWGRVLRDSPGLRLAVDCGAVAATLGQPKFYFEENTDDD